jgi:hypothetical protein
MKALKAPLRRRVAPHRWARLRPPVAKPAPCKPLACSAAPADGPGWFESTRELLLGLQIQEIWQDDEEGGEMPATA